MLTKDLIEEIKTQYDLKFEVTQDIIKVINHARSVGYKNNNKDVKHDIANCLCVISGYIDIFGTDNLTDKQKKILNNMLETSIQCSQLLSKIT